jgi:hypothetical protein
MFFEESAEDDCIMGSLCLHVPAQKNTQLRRNIYLTLLNSKLSW